MCHISIHHSKEEGESYIAENSGIYLLVIRDSVCVGNLLEHSVEVVEFKICGRDDSMILSLINLRAINVSVTLNLIYLLF
jgi:hypothetical protein